MISALIMAAVRDDEEKTDRFNKKSRLKVNYSCKVGHNKVKGGFSSLKKVLEVHKFNFDKKPMYIKHYKWKKKYLIFYVEGDKTRA